MSQPRRTRVLVDSERLILVPALLLLLLANAAQLWRHWSSGDFSSAGGTLTGVHQLLRLTFNGLMVTLLLTHRPARSSAPSHRATLAAYAGTFAPFLLLVGDQRGGAGPTLTAVAIGVTTLGLVLSVYALGWLGRSFGVVPQARELVQSGPYRYVRHPLYVAELITFLGAILAHVTAWSVLVFVFGVTMQAYRASQEEKVLRAVFPEYETYMAQAGRFTPRMRVPA